MPILNWIGKDKVVMHHQDVEVHELVHKYGFTVSGQQVGVTGSGNMIIHGDNLIALKSLLPKYEGRIDCIYIDPPYNTGKENWVYNDNVNDPRILAWLGDVVGAEGEDFTRHDKWLCMMYPRLSLLSRLLSQNGKMAISIGHQELPSLIYLCKYIFPTKQVIPVTVQTSGGKPSGGFNFLHEYIVFVVPNDFEPQSLEIFGGNARTPFEGLTLSTFDQVSRPNQVYPIFINKDTLTIHSVGKSLTKLIDEGLYIGSLEDYLFEVESPNENLEVIWPITSKGKKCCWRLEPNRLLSDWEKGYIKIIPNRHKLCPNKFSVNYLPEGVINKIENGSLQVIGVERNGKTLMFGENQTEGSSIPTIWTEKDFYTVKGTNLIGQIFGVKVFDYPKSLELVTTVLDALTSKDDIVLDSFAGSGTTAHAVLYLNEKDGGNRNFISIEMMEYAEDTTAERVKRVIQGYPYKGKIKETIYSKKLSAANLSKFSQFLDEANAVREASIDNFTKISKPTVRDSELVVEAEKVIDGQMPGLGGAFDFYELGEPIFVDGLINPNISQDTIREYIYFSETRQPLTRPRSAEEPYFLDNYNGISYFFYYKPEHETVLNDTALHDMITENGLGDQYIIYADACTLSENKLKRLGIIFKKIPRQIRKF